jgi:hypothetical protein
MPVLSGSTSDEEDLTGDEIGEGRTLSGIVSTGDMSNILMWVCIMVVAVIVITISIILLILFNRKEKRGNNAQTNS